MKEEKSTKFNLNKLQNQWRVIMREGMFTNITCKRPGLI